MEFLEHGKEKAIVSFKNRWELAKLEFQRTQNSPIPIWDLDARVAAHQRICLDWGLVMLLENQKSAVWGRRNRGDRKAVVAHIGASVNDVPHFST
ncbi:hypothetical protein AVEN_18944-1 [Araneus ventricosus]|uniref:Uncharacterized protein n=1 Tax=Araneus ventricosus TaxID=182803 RepID=A0A4Y2IEW7_ARAVE|nr:hypothetical protein AVEN_18944-1 [Araneus ventricosus]